MAHLPLEVPQLLILCPQPSTADKGLAGMLPGGLHPLVERLAGDAEFLGDLRRRLVLPRHQGQGLLLKLFTGSLSRHPVHLEWIA